MRFDKLSFDRPHFCPICGGKRLSKSWTLDDKTLRFVECKKCHAHFAISGKWVFQEGQA